MFHDKANKRKYENKNQKEEVETLTVWVRELKGCNCRSDSGSPAGQSYSAPHIPLWTGTEYTAASSVRHVNSAPNFKEISHMGF